MKQIMLSMCAMIACVVCVSCSGGKSIEKMIPASKVEITGNGAELIKINGDIKLYTVQSEWKKSRRLILASVEISNAVQQEIDGISGYTSFNLLDENYAIIDDQYGMVMQDISAIISLIGSEPGSSKFIVFEPKYGNSNKKKYIADLIDKVERISFKFETTEPVYITTTSSSSTTSTSSSWDSVLNEYDKFVNQYISLYKKAMNGDMNALTEYTSYLEKIDVLSDKLDAAEGSMTTAQMNRYLKITERMTNAILEE